MKPTIMLDMDGVICDFITEYRKDTSRDSREKFFRAVNEKRIFTKLSKLPNADRLLTLLFKDLNVSVEILSSLGTISNAKVAAAAAKQKSEWLAANGIVCKKNFVNSWRHKQQFATSRTIMIDDRIDVIESFKSVGSHGILYRDADWDAMENAIRDTVYGLYRYEHTHSKHNLMETT